MEINEPSYSITCLPDEIIIMIIKNSDIHEIVCFASTCTRYYQLISNNNNIWRGKYKKLVPHNIFRVVANSHETSWWVHTKSFFVMKKAICKELLSMSSKFYRRIVPVTFEDLMFFYYLALRSNESYYIVIYLLHGLVYKTNAILELHMSQKLFTLTVMFYAKTALRHLIHSYLAVKWVRRLVKRELPPTVVINFFLQWVDTDNYHSDETVNNALNEINTRVESTLALAPQNSSSNVDNQKNILATISTVIYKDMHMAVTDFGSLELLNISKIIHMRYGNVCVIAAIYQSVAKHFGVNCELIAFPNHLFLEWRDSNMKPFNIDLTNGNLYPKRQCPFAQANRNTTSFKYSPEIFLRYVHSVYLSSMGAITNWYTQNSVLLSNFLEYSDDVPHNTYRKFHPYLVSVSDMPSMNEPLTMANINSDYRNIIHGMIALNSTNRSPMKAMKVKKRDNKVKYAVGMICYHCHYNYACLIRGWDHAYDAEGIRREDTDEFRGNQPFYHVLAMDQSERYVAQENLKEIPKPARLLHLEDHFAHEFTHFDGFAYVPNEQKAQEYPEDEPIRLYFKTRCRAIAGPPGP